MNRMHPTDPGAELVTQLTQALYRMFDDLDQRRYDDLIQRFTPAGRWLRQGAWLEGRGAIRGALEARAVTIQVRHVITNVLLREWDADRARADAYLTAYRRDDATGMAATLFRLNLVETEYVRHEGQWLVAQQKLLPEFEFEARP